ncbi:MAG: hypothetical protein F4089_04875 [Gammaproteobacteria bacterium]|nr:hypothetical protein [Gammaproteobacteria bacterium]
MGANVPSLVTTGASNRPDFQAAWINANEDIPVLETFGDLIDHWLAPGDAPEWDSQSLVLPTSFRAETLFVDATEKIEALPSGTSVGVEGYLNWRFTFSQVVPPAPATDYVLTMEHLWTNSVFGTAPTQWLVLATINPRSRPREGHPEDLLRTTWRDNRPESGIALAQFKQEIFASRLVRVELDQGRGYGELYPESPGAVETAIWCSVAPVFGDFAALAITGQDVLQSVASKAVTITTEYHPELEDLDNTFRYGTDSLGRAVIWRVLSTARTERTIELNLTAAAI